MRLVRAKADFASGFKVVVDFAEAEYSNYQNFP
jgi:hypothetical protein